LPAALHPQVAAGVLTPAVPTDPPPEDETKLCETKLVDPSELVAANKERQANSAVRQRGLSATGGLFAPGYRFANRYEIIQLLGAGGMGAVYQAWDQELGVAVAIKIIRPEALADSGNAAGLEHRFKRELLLARQVTHKNVVRIHDLGEFDGIKYITMPFVQGQDLNRILKKRLKLPVDEVLPLASQIVAGLQAAHDAGVIHRDLKPANIMVEGDRAYIMDFGIARSITGDGGTRAGAVVGTLEYMAPEQAMGQPADHRADIYAFGLILHDLLVGRRQGAFGESAVAELMERMRQPPQPVRMLDPDIPRALERIISLCLQPAPAARYQTTQELADDLATLDSQGNERATPGTQTRSVPAVSQPFLPDLTSTAPAIGWGRRRTWLAVGLGAVIVAAIGVFLVRNRAGNTPPATVSEPPVSLAILPFRNASGDSSIDWMGTSLAEMVRTDVGQSARLRTIPSDRLQQILRDLHIDTGSTFDPATLKRLAEFSNADTVLWGQYLKFGNAIRIDATLEDLKHERSSSLKAEAPNQSGLFAAMASLADAARENLALPPDVIAELQKTAVKPSTQSLEALRDYNEGLQFARQGNQSQALKSFRAAVDADKNFALAYSKLGQTYATLGYDNEAEQFSRQAVDRSDSLPPQEKYVVLANHARILNDNQKAIQAYEHLATVAPEDPDVHFNLATLYETVGLFDQAREHYLKLLSRDPNYVEALFGVGQTELRRGNPQASLEYLTRAQTLAVQLGNDEARANVLNAIGTAYRMLGKSDEALRYYEQSLDIKRRMGEKRGMALTLGEMAVLHESSGKPDLALKSFQDAIQLQREIGDKRGLGKTLINLGGFYVDSRGQNEEGLQSYKEALQIEREVGNENLQAFCQNGIGNVYLAQGEYDNALTYFERALQLREKFKVPGDIADTLHNLAETSTNLGNFDQALTYYLRALELRRAADDKATAAIESYSMGTAFGYQGRYGAAVKTKEEALQEYRATQDRGFWLAEILSGYGSALSEAGRADDADKALKEALDLAGELHNQVLIAQTLNYQGENASYRGDINGARDLFNRAMKEAASTTDRRLQLLTKLNVARMAARDATKGKGLQAAVATLKGLAQQAGVLGLKYLAIDSSLAVAESSLKAGDPASARQELERAIAQGERLGTRALALRGHYLMGLAFRQSGNEADAARQFGEARQLLDSIQKEAGNDLLKRDDLKTLIADSDAASAAVRR
jgi:serine/threonine protein kinase/tetratricopeptide (TPR) repeat protein